MYVRTAEVVGMTEQPKNRRRQGEVMKDGTGGEERQQRRREPENEAGRQKLDRVETERTELSHHYGNGARWGTQPLRCTDTLQSTFISTQKVVESSAGSARGPRLQKTNTSSWLGFSFQSDPL